MKYMLYISWYDTWYKWCVMIERHGYAYLNSYLPMLFFNALAIHTVRHYFFGKIKPEAMCLVLYGRLNIYRLHKNPAAYKYIYIYIYNHKAIRSLYPKYRFRNIARSIGKTPTSCVNGRPYIESVYRGVKYWLITVHRHHYAWLTIGYHSTIWDISWNI